MLRAAFLGLVLGAILSTFHGEGIAQEPLVDLLDIPRDESALLVIAGPRGRTLDVSDEAGSLHHAIVTEGDALALQFRVEPGDYQIHLEGRADPIEWTAEPGRVRVLWIGIVPFVPHGVELYQAMRRGDIGIASPVRIDPAGHVLYLNTEPPYPGPFDPPPDNRPKR